MSGRVGDWIQTYTGRQFWPLDPRAEDVDVIDIAHALSMQCRFAGHCLHFYSVAEHSVHVSRAVSAASALLALLHDAAEAYLVDVPRPVKPFLAGYKEAEARIMRVVCAHFGIAAEVPDDVIEADWRILGDERANLSRCVVEWRDPPEPMGVRLSLWSPQDAETAFLARFRELHRLTTEAA